MNMQPVLLYPIHAGDAVSRGVLWLCKKEWGHANRTIQLILVLPLYNMYKALCLIYAHTRVRYQNYGCLISVFLFLNSDIRLYTMYVYACFTICIAVYILWIIEHCATVYSVLGESCPGFPTEFLKGCRPCKRSLYPQPRFLKLDLLRFSFSPSQKGGQNRPDIKKKA